MSRISATIALVALAMPELATARAGISGAAMMRVEVEVYKGPVGQSREIQIGELSALLAETVKAMNAWYEQAEELKKTACDPLGTRDCAILLQAIGSARDVSEAICRIGGYSLPTWQWTRGTAPYAIEACYKYSVFSLKRPTLRLADTKVGAQPEASTIQGDYREYTRRVAIVTSTMQLAAFRLVDANIGYVPRSKNVRHAITSLNFQLSEMGNSISARNSNLQKVFEHCQKDIAANLGRNYETCDDGSSKLPTSAYLRDVEPTRFMEAFGWFNAALDASGTGALQRRNRTRAIKALTEDYYWEKVNEVYASGQGDVSMAFVKDELGNWNLKSYSNDASKLLAAYRGAANAVINSVAKLARGSVAGPAAAAGGNRLLDLADRLTTGTSPGAASIGGLRIEELRSRATARLELARNNIIAREKALFGEGGTLETPISDSELDKLIKAEEAANKKAQELLIELGKRQQAGSQEEIVTAQATYNAAAGSYRTERDKLAVALNEAKLLAESAAKVADEIVQDYQRDIATLQEVVASEASPTPGS